MSTTLSEPFQIKSAKTDSEILELFKQRWSTRAYDEKGIEIEKIKSLLEAARWSASSMNEQPWRFIVGIDKDDTWQKIASALDDYNTLWATKVPVLMLAVGSKKHASDGTINLTYAYDVGQAVAFMSIQAISMGIYCHQMGGFDKNKVIELFHIPPEEYEPLTTIAAGYRTDDLSHLVDRHRNAEYTPRIRKQASDFTFANTWGEKNTSIF